MDNSSEIQNRDTVVSEEHPTVYIDMLAKQQRLTQSFSIAVCTAPGPEPFIPPVNRVALRSVRQSKLQ